jgi:Ca2+-transporting ATPase
VPASYTNWRPFSFSRGSPHVGLRLIGYAKSQSGEPGSFQFVGLLAFDDPVRDDAPAAVALCQGAGIRVIVVSGDHVSTVAAAAEKVRGSST